MTPDSEVGLDPFAVALEVPLLRSARAWNAAKLFAPDSTALMEKTIPIQIVLSGKLKIKGVGRARGMLYLLRSVTKGLFDDSNPISVQSAGRNYYFFR